MKAPIQIQLLDGKWSHPLGGGLHNHLVCIALCYIKSLWALKSTSVTYSRSHKMYSYIAYWQFNKGLEDLKLNHDYASEMSQCNTAQLWPYAATLSVMCYFWSIFTIFTEGTDTPQVSSVWVQQNSSGYYMHSDIIWDGGCHIRRSICKLLLFSENLFGTTKYIIAFVQLHLLILQYDYYNS